jgi:hypothetical protein
VTLPARNDRAADTGDGGAALPEHARHRDENAAAGPQAGEPAPGATVRLDADGTLTLANLPLAPLPEEVEPAGIVFRGAARTAPGPGMPYTVTRRDVVWADNIHDLVERAKRRQWNATTDIPWHAARAVHPDIEEALADVLTWMVQQEYAAWYVPAKFLPRIHPAFSEVGFFLSTQVMDEARHVEVFVKRLYVNGVGLRTVSTGTESSIKGLLAQEDFARASFLLHVLGEGTFMELFHLLLEIAPDEATREIVARSLEDEARHVAYGVGRLRRQLLTASHPDAAGQAFIDALEARLSFTYEVSGIPQHVQEALAVVAGGGRGPAAADRGRSRVQRFVEDLNGARLGRLRQAGFSERVADHISRLHIRSAGGLM